MYQGWINLNKPEGISSAYALNKIKRLLPRKTKIGHAGTLDQLACGVLPVAIGHATKLIPLIMDAKKTYTFTITWGTETTTSDRAGDIVRTSQNRPSFLELETILPYYIGTIEQTPPIYSALKINGKRASDRARKGETVILKKRTITIDKLVCLHHSELESTFQVICSKGTYVRSLATDIASALDTVGFVSFLQRDQVGNFKISVATSLNSFSETKLEKSIYSTKEIFPYLPEFTISEPEIPRLVQGQPISTSLDDTDIALVVFKKEVLSIGRVVNAYFYPKNVFNSILLESSF
jgi:tRNA pseudouridine55 synthase